MFKESSPYASQYFLIWKFKSEDTEEDIKEENDPNEEESAKKKHLNKKRKLKELFDAEYDGGESTYFDDLKGEMQRQAQVRKQAVLDCLPRQRHLLAGSLFSFDFEPRLELCDGILQTLIAFSSHQYHFVPSSTYSASSDDWDMAPASKKLMPLRQDRMIEKLRECGKRGIHSGI